jgi:hypothetical protein
MIAMFAGLVPQVAPTLPPLVATVRTVAWMSE